MFKISKMTLYCTWFFANACKQADNFRRRGRIYDMDATVEADTSVLRIPAVSIDNRSLAGEILPVGSNAKTLLNP